MTNIKWRMRSDEWQMENVPDIGCPCAVYRVPSTVYRVPSIVHRPSRPWR